MKENKNPASLLRRRVANETSEIGQYKSFWPLKANNLIANVCNCNIKNKKPTKSSVGKKVLKTKL